MAIVLSDNIQNNAPKPTDSRYLCNQVPYTSVSQANSVIAGGTGGVRYTGLTVNINGEEYWYKNGIDDGDLIPKVLGGEGNGTVTGATNGLSTILSGTTVVLGGTLSQNTVIGSGEYCLEIPSTGYSSYMTISPTENVTTSKFNFYSNPGGGNCLYWMGASCQSIDLFHSCNYGSDEARLQVAYDQIEFLSRIGTVCKAACFNEYGFIYSNDYSSCFVSRSLPDVAYVTGYTQSAVTQNSNTVNVCNVTTTYSANTTNDFIGVSGATLIYLPQSPKPCQRISIADIKGDALGNNITICSEGMAINGNTTATINTDYGSITFINNGYSWSAVAFIN